MSNIKQRIKFLEADAKHHDVKSSSIMMVSTRTVLAIVEAFRELDVSVQEAAAIISELKESLATSGKMQQLHREAAQAAEAALERESDIHIDTATSMREWRLRAEAAEAQLAELAKQKPVGTVSITKDWNTHRYVATVNMRPDLVVSEMKDGDELFTRAAPAAMPVDLVPGNDLTRALSFAKFVIKCVRKNGEYAPLSSQEPNEINDILRRIEGLK